MTSTTLISKKRRNILVGFLESKPKTGPFKTTSLEPIYYRLSSTNPPIILSVWLFFFHLDCPTADAYSFIKFPNKGFCEKPSNAILMPLGRIRRESMDDNSLDYSFISTQPIMRSGTYKGHAFLAQLTNDILPFPSEPASLYIDLNEPPFWQI